MECDFAFPWYPRHYTVLALTDTCLYERKEKTFSELI
jgi:CRP-like cAMP-binding protein